MLGSDDWGDVVFCSEDRAVSGSIRDIPVVGRRKETKAAKWMMIVDDRHRVSRGGLFRAVEDIEKSRCSRTVRDGGFSILLSSSCSSPRRHVTMRSEGFRPIEYSSEDYSLLPLRSRHVFMAYGVHIITIKSDWVMSSPGTSWPLCQERERRPNSDEILVLGDGSAILLYGCPDLRLCGSINSSRSTRQST